MTADHQEKTAAALLELLAVVVVGDLVTQLGDPVLRELYAKLMARCVELRDAGAK